MICPYIVNVSVLLGAILSWGIMWPLIGNKKGSWYAADLSDTNLHGLQGYRVTSHPSAYKFCTEFCFERSNIYTSYIKYNDTGFHCYCLDSR